MRPTLALTVSLALSSFAVCAPLVPAAYAAGASDTDQERAARWQEIAKSIFGDRKIERTDTLVTLDTPKRAEDAALVPITLSMPDRDKIKAVSLIIDDNPAPYAAKFEFGPAADTRELKLRVRVNNYTDMHAVVETTDGKLYEAKQFVKASGGCSAPMGMSDEEAMKGMGDMRMKFADAHADKPVAATLMIRHPNFSGMQMNQVTREYTPARYIDKLTVSAGDQTVFTMTGDISIASNPVINFSFKPDGKPIQVAASDNQGGHWTHSFPVPSQTN
jgi:sulfur-oxidizing protein SoxY